MNTKPKSVAKDVSILIFSTIVFFILIVLPAGFSVSTHMNEERDRLDREMHDQQLVEQLDNNVQLVISELRAYMAFGRPESLERFTTLREQADERFVVVAAQFGTRDYGEPLEQEWKEIAAAWEGYKQSAIRAIELRKSGNQSEIERLSRESTTTYITDISRNLETILDAQEKAVQQWLDDNRRKISLLLALPLLMIAGVALAGVWLVLYLRRRIIQPIKSVEEAVRTIAAGEIAEPVASGRHDELGRLARGIGEVSVELRRRHEALTLSNQELIAQRDLLEAQNEEISAQQNEQEDMLLKLTARERELEQIAAYQERLTGHVEMKQFLECTLRSLLQALRQDAVVLAVPDEASEMYKVAYAYGYPVGAVPAVYGDLFGPARQAMEEQKPVVRVRQLDDGERGMHGGYSHALDQYYPILDSQSRLIGLLLLTAYDARESDDALQRLTKGLVHQFSLAFVAQATNEERHRQAVLLEELNEELSQERDSLQAQRDFIGRMIESVHEGIVMCDRHGRILFSNERMNAMFEFDKRSGTNIRTFIEHLEGVSAQGKPLAGKIKELFEGHIELLQERFSHRSDDKSATHYELYINALPDPDDQSRSYLFVFRDRTHEEKINEMKNEFIGIVSHELRTPLASVLGFMEILLHRDVSAEKRHKYLETIYREARRLGNLINDFLDLQRMESGKQVYRPVPIELSEAVREAAEQWSGKQTHRIETELEPELFVLADMDRITQMMHNLVSNAVKYSPQADRVIVRISSHNDAVIVEVQDFGLGIPEEAKDKLFEKFYRVDNTDRRQIGGTGLGLAIVKEIADAHQGTVSFVSELGRGSTFRVRFPRYQPVSLSGHVVIVEDDDNLSKLVAVAFEKLRVSTVRLRSAEEAVLALKATTGSAPLLCIVDIQLDGKRSGWDYIAELLRHPVYKLTPVIVSTVLEPPEHYHETDTGKFLRKPFTVERLLEVASELMGLGPSGPTVVFPAQSKEKIAASLEKEGIRVTDWKIRRDIIEVEVNKDE